MKNLIVFDLDGTLAESKAPLDAEMAGLLDQLLAVVRVAVISGGAWPQFQQQVLTQLPDNDGLNNLSLLPTCGTRFYRRHDGAWKNEYAEDFSAADRDRIVDALNASFDASGFRAPRHWGPLIEDRGSQITLSALGQDAPLAEKKAWDPDFRKREKIKAALEARIPGFSVHLGGATSIDITRPGIDKGYGIGKLRDMLDIAIAEMVFVGDALFPGGNDYPARQAGVLSIAVRDPHETKRVIEAIVACRS
jgi:HAD superfamily hydrolase (TIGR01484 family)